MLLGGRRYKVATIRGIPLYVDAGWLLIAVLYLSLQYLVLSNSAWRPTDGEAIGLAGVSFVLFFGGVLVHESAHAVVARAFDLPVAGITFVFWGGATETRADAKGPFIEFLVAAAGPVSTLLLSFGFTIARMSMEPSLLREVVAELAWLNLIFAGFNALPGFPLDGGRVLLAAAWGISKSRRTGLRVAGWGGLVVGAGFVAFAANAIVSDGDIGRAFFFGYLGAVLLSTGRSMSQRIALRDRLVVGAVADAMRPPPPTLPASTSLSQALDMGLRDEPTRPFPVADAGRVVGTVSLESARKLGGRDPLRPVRDAMTPLNQTPTLAPDDTLDDAFEWLGGREALVLREGVLVGALAPADVERWYRGRFEAPSVDRGTAPPRPDL
jgi:Zn-dependent protease/CBS domain-containing protein